MIDVLFVEDEAKLALIVSESLETQQFRVRHCANGSEGWYSFIHAKPDIVVLDVMMPELDGFSLAAKIRQHDSSVPMIFLTARGATEDVLHGFKVGANDYLKKPFEIDELIARMEALLKFAQKYHPEEQLAIGKFILNPIKHVLTHHGAETQLSFRESELLKRLYERRNQVVPRREIVNEFWSNERFITGRSLDVFISRLRKFLSDDPSIQIVNVRGVGYKMIVVG